MPGAPSITLAPPRAFGYREGTTTAVIQAGAILQCHSREESTMPDAPLNDVSQRGPIDAEELLAIRDLVADLGRPDIMRGAWR